MEKSDYLELIKNNYTEKSQVLLNEQVELYFKNETIKKTKYSVNDDVKLKSPKKNFSSKYEQLIYQLAEFSQNETPFTNESLNSKKENNNYKIFKANLTKQKNENMLDQQLFKAKLHLLTGKNIDNISFKSPTNVNNNSAIYSQRNSLNNPLRYSNTNQTTPSKQILNIDIVNNNNTKSVNALKDFKKFMIQNTDVTSGSKLLKESKKKDNYGMTRNILKTDSNEGSNKNNEHRKNNNNNEIVNKIRKTFPEYIDVNYKGKSFIFQNDTSANKQKISQLRNKISKI